MLKKVLQRLSGKEQETEPTSSSQKEHMSKTRQQLLLCDTGLCTTIPEKVIKIFDINTKRYFEWEETSGEVIGTFCLSETALTTKIRRAPHDRLRIQVLSLYVQKFKLRPTKQGGPMAVFEWDEATLRICILVKKHAKK